MAAYLADADANLKMNHEQYSLVMLTEVPGPGCSKLQEAMESFTFPESCEHFRLTAFYALLGAKLLLYATALLKVDLGKSKFEVKVCYPTVTRLVLKS